MVLKSYHGWSTNYIATCHETFLQESTIHGIRYFVDGENLLHKIVWVIIVGFSVAILSYLIYDASVSVFSLLISTWVIPIIYSSDWEENPGISTIDRVKLSELEFPAITVCPEFATDSLATRTIFNK